MKTSVHSWTKKLQSTSQSQICTKKGHGHWLSVAHPLQLSESWQNHYICKVCSTNQWNALETETPAFFSTTVPDRLLHIQHFTGWTGLKSPATSAIFTWHLLPTDYHFLKHLNNFLQGKCFHDQLEAENAFQEFVKSRSTDFYTIGIHKLISHWQKCADYNGSYFD